MRTAHPAGAPEDGMGPHGCSRQGDAVLTEQAVLHHGPQLHCDACADDPAYYEQQHVGLTDLIL
jgi:hypothetical protein